MTRANLYIPGDPAPKGSRTSGTRRDGAVYSRESNPRTGPWTETVAWYARAAAGPEPLEPPYSIDIYYVMPRPKRPKYPWPSRSDGDKLDRAIYDALVRGGLLVDDRHAIDRRSRERYPEPGEATGVHITIT